jgi:hypothetical protein
MDLPHNESRIFLKTVFGDQYSGSGFDKDPDPDWYDIQPKMLDPDTYQMNTDPKHCLNVDVDVFRRMVPRTRRCGRNALIARSSAS